MIILLWSQTDRQFKYLILWVKWSFPMLKTSSNELIKWFIKCRGKKYTTHAADEKSNCVSKLLSWVYEFFFGVKGKLSSLELNVQLFICDSAHTPLMNRLNLSGNIFLCRAIIDIFCRKVYLQLIGPLQHIWCACSLQIYVKDKLSIVWISLEWSQIRQLQTSSRCHLDESKVMSH